VKLLVGLSFVFCCAACSRPPSNDPADAASAHAFVQAFYEWYVPLATSDKLNERASTVAITKRKAVFSPELWAALKDDADAQAHSNEIVGIDWDPFLNSQDPCEKYDAGRVRKDKDGFLVDIYATCQGQKMENPSITAILSKSNGRWYFTNFVDFDKHIDLMQSLALLKKDREQPAESR
jgi:hypothetical protein